MGGITFFMYSRVYSAIRSVLCVIRREILIKSYPPFCSYLVCRNGSPLAEGVHTTAPQHSEHTYHVILRAANRGSCQFSVPYAELLKNDRYGHHYHYTPDVAGMQTKHRADEEQRQADQVNSRVSAGTTKKQRAECSMSSAWSGIW